MSDPYSPQTELDPDGGAERLRQEVATALDLPRLLILQLEAIRRKRIAFETAAQELWGGSKPVRREAARGLADYGEWAVAPLCSALEDPNQKVREAAARSLGEIGDVRAIGPLTRALRLSLVGGSARRQLVSTALVILGFLGVVIAEVLGFSFIRTLGGLGGALMFWFFLLQPMIDGYLKSRRAASGLCREISQSLAQIAERNPAPELRALLPELKAISLDVVQQDGETRAVSRDAARRIEAVTEQLQALPIAATVPPLDTTTLPRPAGCELRSERVNG